MFEEDGIQIDLTRPPRAEGTPANGEDLGIYGKYATFPPSEKRFRPIIPVQTEQYYEFPSQAGSLKTDETAENAIPNMLSEIVSDEANAALLRLIAQVEESSKNTTEKRPGRIANFLGRVFSNAEIIVEEVPVVNRDQYMRLPYAPDDTDKSTYKIQIDPEALAEQEREQESEYRDRQRKAHAFRSQRMRLGQLGDFADWLQETNNTAIKAGVSAIVKRHERLHAKTKSDGEMHREYAPLLAGILSEAESRRTFMNSLDAAAQSESNDLKELAQERTLDTDILIVGAGVQSAIFAATMRAQNPEVDMLSIDRSDRPGGQFRSYGNRPVFFINSRNFREQASDVVGQPSGDGNLNSFGKFAPIQITDFTYETYPTNMDLGDAAAINQHLSARSMLGVELLKTLNIGTEQEPLYVSQVQDIATGEVYAVRSKMIVNLSGAGKRPEAKVPTTGGVWTAEDVLKHFADEANLFPMDAFEGKEIAIVGGGDTGRIIAELLYRLGPKEAYGKSSVQLGGVPTETFWYGTDFNSQEEFAQTNRSRYQRLASFISTTRKRNPAGTIFPTQLRAREIDSIVMINDGQEQRKGVVTTEYGDSYFDAVIDARTLINKSISPFARMSGKERTHNVVVDRLGVVEGGKQIDQDVYIYGPSAQISLTANERQLFADGIKENTVAIWANGVRVEALAMDLAGKMRTIKGTQKVREPRRVQLIPPRMAVDSSSRRRLVNV